MKSFFTYIFIHLAFISLILGQSESQLTQLDSIKILYQQKDFQNVVLQASKVIQDMDEQNVEQELQMIELLSLMGKSCYHLKLYSNSIEMLTIFLNDPSYVLSEDFEQANRQYLANAIQAIESDTNIIQQESITKTLIEENRELKERIESANRRHTSLMKIDDNDDRLGTILFFSFLIVILGLIFYLYQNRKRDSLTNDQQLLQFQQGLRKRINIAGRDLRATNIQFIKKFAKSNYADVFFLMNDKKEKLTTTEAVVKIYERLPQAHFVRINGSFVMNLSNDYTKEKSGRDWFILFDDHKEKLTETYRAEFRHKKDNYDNLIVYNTTEKSTNTT